MTARHHKLLCGVADSVIEGRQKRVIISLPPRHTKSEIFSIRMAARYLGVHPDRQILHISYASSLSNDFSRQVRALLRDDPVYRELFPAVQLDPERARLDDWKLVQGGGFRSIGVSGGITGLGAHLIIIDDPVKEGDEQSMTVLDQTFDWYLSAARTRLAPGGAIVVVMTRWHPSDLVGRLVDMQANRSADQWTVLTLPALAGQKDLLGRKPGEALWPERYSVADLESMRALSPRYFEALYQQNPQPDATKLFFGAKFQRGAIPDQAKCIWTVDLAISEGQDSDYSVWARWFLDRNTNLLYVGQIERKRQEWPETKAQLVALIAEHPQDEFIFPKDTFELMAVQELRSVLGAEGRRVRQVALSGDKRARASVYADVVGAGRAVVEGGAAGDQFISEHDRFPDRHDDCVDVSSVATHFYGLHKPFSARFVDDAPPRDEAARKQYTEAKLAEYWSEVLKR